MHNEFWSLIGLGTTVLTMLILLGIGLSSIGPDDAEHTD